MPDCCRAASRKGGHPMSIIPRVSRHSLAAGLSVAALAVAGSVAATAGAGPAHAASCSAGYVGLTFDDGPSNDHTPALLSALKQNGLKATLFNEGQYAAAYPAQVQAEVAAGMRSEERRVGKGGR